MRRLFQNMLQGKEVGFALASLLSWLLFSDTPSDPEGYVRDPPVSSLSNLKCLLLLTYGSSQRWSKEPERTLLNF
jgi:hypothetical protein